MIPPIPLSRAEHRARATALVETARPDMPTDASTLVHSLEAVSAALLRGAGVGDDAARTILGTLWDAPVHTSTATVPPRTPRRVEHERVFLRQLGERVKVIRRARHRSSDDLARILDLAPLDLRNLEAGFVAPSVLLLYRLAAVLQVPVPMLVDPRATPAKVLRLLAVGQP
jgi:DNA-binding XRE family transcriptional regulator